MSTRTIGTLVCVRNANSVNAAFLHNCVASVVRTLEGHEKGLERLETTLEGEDTSIMLLVFSTQTVRIPYKISNETIEVGGRATNDADFAAVAIKHFLVGKLS